MSDLPAPLTPADCDLRGLPFMPLDVVRLGDSDLFALSTGDEFKAAVALWGKSWLQVPAASLPDDDRILAHLSSTGPGWKTVKDMALRGWVKCSDGRLYHGVIAAKAAEAWRARSAQRARANKRWHGTVDQAAASEGPHMPADYGGPEHAHAAFEAPPMPPDSNDDATAYAAAMQGTGRGRGTVEGNGELALSKGRARRARTIEEMPKVPAWMPADPWSGYVAQRRGRSAMTPHACRLVLQQLDEMRGQGIDVAEVLNQSIRNGWTGLFPPSSVRRPGGGGRPDPAMSEDWQRLDKALGIDQAEAFP